MSKKDDVEMSQEDVDRMVKEYLANGGTVTECEKFARTEDLDMKTVWTKRKKKQYEWNYCNTTTDPSANQSSRQKNTVLVFVDHSSLDCTSIVWLRFSLIKRLTYSIHMLL